MIFLKLVCISVLMFASLSLVAAEIKIIEVGSKELFGFERIEPEFIFKKNLQAGVSVKLSSSFLGLTLPRDKEVILKEMSFDNDTGDILVTTSEKKISCATVNRKKNGSFARSITATGACKFEQRYEEALRRVNDQITRVQVLEIYLSF